MACSIGDGTAEERTQGKRQRREERGHARARGAAGGDEHEPRDRDCGDRVSE
jgi:hypothetical protein